MGIVHVGLTVSLAVHGDSSCWTDCKSSCMRIVHVGLTVNRAVWG